MKPILTALLLSFTTSACFADVAVYNGFEVVNTTSLDGTSNVARKTIEVIDLANSKMVFITLGLDKSRKKGTFEVGATMEVLITKVQDSRGNKKSTTTLSTAQTTTDAATGITEVSSFLQQGGDLNVVIKGTEKTLLPRNMHGAAFLVSTAGDEPEDPPTGPPPPAPPASAKIEIKSTYVLQELASRTSNNAGDTLDAAVDRIRTNLLAKGYVEILPPPPPPTPPTP
jgi:hypothetical protein